VFKEPVVLNGYRRMDQVLWNILIFDPFLLNVSMKLLQSLNIAIRINIICIGCFIQKQIVQLGIGIGKNVVFQIIAQNAYKYQQAHACD